MFDAQDPKSQGICAAITKLQLHFKHKLCPLRVDSLAWPPFERFSGTVVECVSQEPESGCEARVAMAVNVAISKVV
jgi:hypothetical protein